MAAELSVIAQLLDATLDPAQSRKGTSVDLLCSCYVMFKLELQLGLAISLASQ